MTPYLLGHNGLSHNGLCDGLGLHGVEDTAKIWDKDWPFFNCNSNFASSSLFLRCLLFFLVW